MISEIGNLELSLNYLFSVCATLTLQNKYFIFIYNPETGVYWVSFCLGCSTIGVLSLWAVKFRHYLNNCSACEFLVLIPRTLLLCLCYMSYLFILHWTKEGLAQSAVQDRISHWASKRKIQDWNGPILLRTLSHPPDRHGVSNEWYTCVCNWIKGFTFWGRLFF